MWNKSFIGMKQEFPYNEMKASCRETIKKDKEDRKWIYFNMVFSNMLFWAVC
ncbi:hypothetical protein PRABACTJOHN_00437 [Parabacteroides johnsonii DSM 18315]|uniref:Uncharacterized protein n=1 Tax=Parabacteroides johnsonii DSM 18315 TaxID=537006 RepID=B7B5Z3_9BACT|nr:hypothetical protein PRABACTJOHN_00437 [Parabacteroides johnsonii DSM 18315]